MASLWMLPKMFDYSEKSKKFQQQLQSFLDRHIYPNEIIYSAQLDNAENRFAPLTLMEELHRWSKDELRSLNAQIEYVLRDAVRKRRKGCEAEEAEEG